MSNILRRIRRTGSELTWKREGVDLRTGEVGPLRKGMTPLWKAQGSTKPDSERRPMNAITSAMVDRARIMKRKEDRAKIKAEYVESIKLHEASQRGR